MEQTKRVLVSIIRCLIITLKQMEEPEEVVEVGSTKVVSESEVARTISIRKIKEEGGLVSVEEEKMEKVEPKDYTLDDLRKIKTLEMTCGACPAQWEGTLENGDFFYIRYRHDSLTWGIGKDEWEAVDNSDYHVIEIEPKISDTPEDEDSWYRGGFMTTKSMKKILGLS